MVPKKIVTPVLISEGRIESFPDFINFIFEYLIFFKWVYFKNRPRGNLLLLRSAFIVGSFSALYFKFFGDFKLVLEGIDVDPAIALGAAVVIGYWNMTGVFHKKSAACQDMYVRILKAISNGNKSEAEILSCSFSIQLLTLDLWAHRTFRGLFAYNVEEAIKYCYELPDHESPIDTSEAMEVYFTNVNRGKAQSKEIRAALDEYLGHLLSKAYQRSRPSNV